MGFPDIESFPIGRPGPYERQMGREISLLLSLFADCSPDGAAHRKVSELCASEKYWTAGHAVFDEVRRRLLRASDERQSLLIRQYTFLEACCQSLYNATDPKDPFDPSSAFYVWPFALSFADAVGLDIGAFVESANRKE